MTSLRLCFVCTGNICRSPSAEHLLRTRLDHLLGPEGKRIEIGSAGLGTPGGWELDPEISRLFQAHGIAGAETFRSRRLNEDVLAEADLVLTGTKAHRLDIGSHFPEAYQRTFTMREATALFAATPETAQLPTLDVVERARAAIALLQRSRSGRSFHDHEIDIADPHGRRTAAYETMFREVRSVVDVLSFVLAPAPLRQFGVVG